MTKKNKKTKKFSYGRYAVGADVIGQAGAFGGQALSQLAGQDTLGGGFLSGAGSGVGLGASIGSIVPGIGTAIGAVAGGLIGGIGGLMGAGAKQKAAKKAAKTQQVAFDKNYTDQINMISSNPNENPYGNQLFALGGEVDPVTGKPIVKKGPTLDKNWDGMVEKADGTIGMWGNAPAPIVDNTQYGLYPKGAMNQADYTYLQSLKDNKVNKALGLFSQKPGQIKQYGTAESDMFRTLLANRAPKMANGGDIFPNIINIEKGELQIDTKSGKILREYKGINPETAGLYQPHSTKGKDPVHNMVTAEPETFIITKAKAKEYKRAVDENDKLKKDTILHNIRNYKSKVENGTLKFDNGGGVLIDKRAQDMFSTMNSPTAPKGKIANGVLGAIANYGPSLLNIGQGLFGKVEEQAYGTKTINPYLTQTLSNMPQDVSFDPIRRDVFNQQRSAFNRIDNSTNSSAVARANKNSLLSNTQSMLGKLRLDNHLTNNSIRGQRGSIYNQLGQQDMQEQNRLNGYNFNVDQINAANRGAKSNMLNTGLGQLQQTYMNGRTNTARAGMEEKQLALLAQIFPNILNSDYAGLFTR